MKPQNIAVAAIAVFIAVGLAWWIVLPAASPSKPADSAPPPPVNSAASVPAGTPAASPLVINSPSAHPASASAPAPLAPAAINPANDPRRELATTIRDMVQRLDKSDLAGYLTLYAPPDQLQNLLKVNNVTIDQFVQNAILQPGFTEQMQRARETLRTLQNAQPDYNAAGDVASFVISPPPATGPKVLVFRKINGLWYVQN